MEWGHFCTGKATVPRGWEHPREEGDGGEWVVWLCMAGGVSGGEHLLTHTQPRGAELQDHVTLGKTGLDVRNSPILESRAAGGGVRGQFSCSHNA